MKFGGKFHKINQIKFQTTQNFNIHNANIKVWKLENIKYMILLLLRQKMYTAVSG